MLMFVNVRLCVSPDFFHNNKGLFYVFKRPFSVIVLFLQDLDYKFVSVSKKKRDFLNPQKKKHSQKQLHKYASRFHKICFAAFMGHTGNPKWDFGYFFSGESYKLFWSFCGFFFLVFNTNERNFCRQKWD